MEAQILVGGTMLDSILVGGITSLINLIIHAVLLAGVARTVRRLSVSDQAVPEVLQSTLVIVAVGTLLVGGHFFEVVVWAHTYDIVGAAPSGTDLVYFAFGNYTTLGYGDVVPLPQWHMLGPMTALNGIMLIGLSTALLVVIIQHLEGVRRSTMLRRPAKDAT